MRDRITQRFRPGGLAAGGSSAVIRRPHTSRREQELRQRRLLYIFMGVAGVIVVLALVIGAAWEYYFNPRGALASVNGEEIERRDYWKVREFQLRQQMFQLSQQFQFVPADQQSQIQQRIELIQAELDDLGNAPVAADTLGTMVDNLVVIQNMDDVGVDVSDAEIDAFIEEQFAPVPLTTPTPTATVEPTAAAWATETAEAQAAEATEAAEAAQQTATALGTPAQDEDEAEDTEGVEDAEATEDTDDVEGAEVTAEADAAGTPEDEDEDEVADEAESPEAGTPAAEEATPAPTATPNPEEARATAAAEFERFEEDFLDEIDMSRDEYERLIVLPALARMEVRDALVEEIPARADQVHAAHILVATEEAAEEVVDRLEDEEFEDVAREVSTDVSTAGTGGDLGWFPRGLMPEEFDEVAFDLEPGEISEPVRTEFGWHVITVLDQEEDRPISIPTMTRLQGEVFEEWLEAQREDAEIESEIPLPSVEETTDTPFAPQTFQAPPDAPIPPTPTPFPTPTAGPEATPGADEDEPAEDPDATPSD